GYGTMPLLSACDSPLMRLVYLDETAVVFVLTSALTPEMNAPALDCKTAPIAPPRDAGGSGGELRRDGAGGSGGELRLDGAGKAARYRYWTNVARLFLVLHRLAEA